MEVEERRHQIEDLVRELTLEEKARLTAGADMWSTAAVERLGTRASRRRQSHCATSAGRAVFSISTVTSCAKALL